MLALTRRFIRGSTPRLAAFALGVTLLVAPAAAQDLTRALAAATRGDVAAVNGMRGSLDRIERIVKLGAFVSSTADFTDQPKVANGASELMATLFGDAGKHARSAVGVPALPLGAAVEVDAIVAVRAD